MDAEADLFRPGSLGCHEAMHMASVLMEMVDTHLCEHPALRSRPDWQQMADEARERLFQLYQAIGREHMP